jgi:hypothetical protein
MACTKFCLLRKPRAVYFTHWILALMDSLAALVTLAAEVLDPVRGVLPLVRRIHVGVERAERRVRSGRALVGIKRPETLEDGRRYEGRGRGTCSH